MSNNQNRPNSTEQQPNTQPQGIPPVQPNYFNPYQYYYNPYAYYYGYNVPQPFYANPNPYIMRQPGMFYPPPPVSRPSIQTQVQPPPPQQPQTRWWEKPPPPPPQPVPIERPTTQTVKPKVSLSLKKPNELAKRPSIFNDKNESSPEINKKSPDNSKKEIPESLKEYVRRSFKTCKNDKQKDKMEVKIRDFLKKVIDDGTAFTKNWSTIPPLNALAQAQAANIDITRKLERQNRFDNKNSNIMIKTMTTHTKIISNETTIIGTSTALEKNYLRLTTAVDPGSVRPLSILYKAFDHILKKWESLKNYQYLSEQLKSIRQDLTVQGIKDEFAVRVYEENARVSLMMGDREEFNQCQTVLKELYGLGLKGNEIEFLVYRILYLTYTVNHIEMTTLLCNLKNDLEKQLSVNLSIKLYFAYCSLNFSKFFKIYHQIDLPCAKALIDLFVNQVRRNAFKAIVSSYLPKIDMNFLVDELALNNIDQLYIWLNEQNITFFPGEPLDCKQLRSQLNSLSF